MALIIDGYNVLFHQNWHLVGKTLEQQRQHLIDRINLYQRRCRLKKIILVFDGRWYLGANRIKQPCGLEIVYASSPGRADGKIVALSRFLHKVRVVTEDRQLAQQVKRYKAIVVPTGDFLQELSLKLRPASTREEKLTPQQSNIEYWLNVFQLDAEIEIPPITNMDLPAVYHHKKKKRKN